MFEFNENFPPKSVPAGDASAAAREIAGRETLALTQSIFAEPDAWLRRKLRMEERPQQTKMALAAARAFAEASALLVEAGTGVGKSLAYLLPGLIFAKLTSKKFVVSTHTIPLQEQILKNDIPLCRELFERVPALQRFADFEVVLMVGRANYLCGTRLAQALKRTVGLFDGNDGSDEARQLRKIADWWATPGCSGLREHLPMRVSDDVWESISADSAVCSRKHCSPENCAYRRARAAVDRATLVVVNHSLLFALIGAGATPANDASGILYPNDFAVIDEAHRVPDVATDYFGPETSSAEILRLLSRIEKAATKKGGILYANRRGNGNLFGSAGTAGDAGNSAAGTPNSKELESRRALPALVAAAKSAVEDFFAHLRFTFLEKNPTFRFREPNWAQNLCEIPLGNLESKLKQIAQLEQNSSAKDEIADFAARVSAHRLTIRECLELRGVPARVYWAILSAGKQRSVSLLGKPIDVAQELAETIFLRKTSVVFSSATLTDGSSMARFRARCGADFAESQTPDVDEFGVPEPNISVRELVENSPFDFEANMEIFLAKGFSEPDSKNAGALDTRDLVAVCRRAVETVPDGGTLVLCTSFELCRAIADALREPLEKAGRELLEQNPRAGIPRRELIRRFTARGNAVLVGTSSFWTGIDVPGSALSQLIIVRLPFGNPSEPLTEARSEKIAENGGKPFFEMSLPDAVLQFRQGVGRLIRKADDRGRLLVLDSRVLTKSYGRRFIAALPHANYKILLPENFGALLTPFPPKS